MTCCKFSTGCYLNCDFGSCKAWCRKLQHYKSKICGIREKFSDQKTSKKHSALKKKSDHANVMSKACLNDAVTKHDDLINGTDEKKNVDSSANTEKAINVLNDEDEFCDCEYNPASYVSLVCSNANLAHKTRETVRSMVNILGDLHQRCFSEEQENEESPRDSKSRDKGKDLLKKPLQPENLDCKPSIRHKSKKRSTSVGKNERTVCCKQQSSAQMTENCGRQFSMSAVMDKIKQGVSFLSPEDSANQEKDCEDISEDKQKRINKCKLLENLKDGTAESKNTAGNAEDSKNCYVMDKIIYWRNSVAECHRRLQQVIPRVCMTFDRTNRTLVVKRGAPCDKDVQQCKKD